MKSVSIFGSTGSVGQSTVDVILSQPDMFDVKVLTAGSNVDLLAEQAMKLEPDVVVIADEDGYASLKEKLSATSIEIAAGPSALIEAAEIPAEVIMMAILGFAGLEPLMKAIEQGTSVAIANKEPLVAAGALVMEKAWQFGTTILPVDSEHNAIFQVFDAERKDSIERIILTASGGPFLKASIEEIETATPAQAVAHPNWSMGRKISVDSATMMNKALEVIEAHYLFGLMPDKIDVVIHPQSVIHSMVEYSDGSVLAQMGAPDMKTPIAYALAWPDRMPTPGKKLNLNDFMSLEIQPVDKKQFPSIVLSYQALTAGPAACIAMNAANEIAVEAFLDEKIGFVDIVKIVSQIVGETEDTELAKLGDIIEFDKAVRQRTLLLLGNNVTELKAKSV